MAHYLSCQVHWKRIVGFIVVLACQTVVAEADTTVFGRVTVESKKGVVTQPAIDVVVFLDGVPTYGDNTAETSPVTISQAGRQFTPRVLPLVRGSAVRFPNDDSIYHNVFSLSTAKRFDLGIYPAGESKHVIFDRPGLVKVHCNLHPNMVSNVLVLNNPYFAKTDDLGRYRISNVPPGTFVLRVWGETVGEAHREVMISDAIAIEENFVVNKVQRARQHKNKFGMPYREKY